MELQERVRQFVQQTLDAMGLPLQIAVEDTTDSVRITLSVHAVPAATASSWHVPAPLAAEGTPIARTRTAVSFGIVCFIVAFLAGTAKADEGPRVERPAGGDHRRHRPALHSEHRHVLRQHAGSSGRAATLQDDLRKRVMNMKALVLKIAELCEVSNAALREFDLSVLSLDDAPISGECPNLVSYHLIFRLMILGFRSWFGVTS